MDFETAEGLDCSIAMVDEKLICFCKVVVEVVEVSLSNYPIALLEPRHAKQVTCSA